MCKGCDMRTALLVRQSEATDAFARRAAELFARDGSEVLGVLADEARALAVEFAGPAKRHDRPRTRAARKVRAERTERPIIEPNGQAAMRV